MALVALAVACAPLACGRHPKAGKVPAPTVPDAIIASSDEAPMIRATSDGMDKYECKRDDKGAPVWVDVAPDLAPTTLYDETGLIGRRSRGPVFESSDGSMAVAKVKSTVKAPDGQGVDWVLYTTTPSGNGAFGKVTSVQRVNTVGGLPPPAGCDAQNIGATHSVAFRATYYFYSTSP
jgi:hypothetical protein